MTKDDNKRARNREYAARQRAKVRAEPEDYRSTLRNWVEDAACAGQPLAVFYPEKAPTNAPIGNEHRAHYNRHRFDAALRVCAGCPVKEKCLQDAVDMGDLWGVRGGTTPGERERLVGRRPLPESL